MYNIYYHYYYYLCIYIYIICIDIYYIRPRHDMQIKKKKAWTGDEKHALPGGKAAWADCP